MRRQSGQGAAVHKRTLSCEEREAIERKTSSSGSTATPPRLGLSGSGGESKPLAGRRGTAVFLMDESLTSSQNPNGTKVNASVDSSTYSAFQEEPVESPSESHHPRYNPHDQSRGDDEAVTRNRLIRINSNLTAAEIFDKKSPQKSGGKSVDTNSATSDVEYSDDANSIHSDSITEDIDGEAASPLQREYRRQGRESNNFSNSSKVFDEVDAKVYIYLQLVQVGPMNHAFQKWRRYTSGKKALFRQWSSSGFSSPTNASSPSVPKLDMRKVNNVRKKEEDLEDGPPPVIQAKKHVPAAARGTVVAAVAPKKEPINPSKTAAKPAKESSASSFVSPPRKILHRKVEAKDAAQERPRSTDQLKAVQLANRTHASPVKPPPREGPTSAFPLQRKLKEAPQPPPAALPVPNETDEKPKTASGHASAPVRKLFGPPRCAPPPVLRKPIDLGTSEIEHKPVTIEPLPEPVDPMAERRAGFHVDVHNVGHHGRWQHAQRRHYSGGDMGGRTNVQLS